jgi:methylglyoxal synthase
MTNRQMATKGNKMNTITQNDVEKLVDAYVKVLQPLPKDKFINAVNKLSNLYDIPMEMMKIAINRRRTFSRI